MVILRRSASTLRSTRGRSTLEKFKPFSFFHAPSFACAISASAPAYFGDERGRHKSSHNPSEPQLGTTEYRVLLRL